MDQGPAAIPLGDQHPGDTLRLLMRSGGLSKTFEEWVVGAVFREVHQVSGEAMGISSLQLDGEEAKERSTNRIQSSDVPIGSVGG